MKIKIKFRRGRRFAEDYIPLESDLQNESKSNEAPQRPSIRRRRQPIRRPVLSGGSASELQKEAKKVYDDSASENESKSNEAPQIRRRKLPVAADYIPMEMMMAYYPASEYPRPSLLRSPSYTTIDVEPQSFQGIDKSLLAKLVGEKVIDQLHKLGGVPGVALMLKTHVENGINSNPASISSRLESFGSNTIQMPYAKMLRIALATLKDPISVLLLLTAILSLGFGIKRDRFSDALFLIVSLFIVMAAICLCDIWAARKFHALSTSNNSISTVVVRDGRKQQIPANDVVVGDLVYLEIGDQVPADGLMIVGYAFQVSESSLTSDPNSVKLPFLLSGSKVTDGYARMLVTAVGMDTKWGEMMNSKCPADIKTPLQVKLHKLTWNTAMVGLAIASMVFMVLLIQYFTGNMKDDGGAVVYTSSKSIRRVIQDIIGILVACIVIASTNIPEGLLLAVTINLAYSAKRMVAENAVVRNLAAFEEIGSITVLCVDRSSIVSPEVEQLWLGQMNSSTRQDRPPSAGTVLQLLHEGIGLNTSFRFDELRNEKAIHAWAVQVLGMDKAQLERSCSMYRADRLNLQKKLRLICIERNGDNRVHVHTNGPIRMILRMCYCYYGDNGEVMRIGTKDRKKFRDVAKEMKNNGLNCIAYAHTAISGYFDEEQFYPRPKGLILIGFLGLKDLFRPNISKALTECQQAGVTVKMMTTEDSQNARESALTCGIFSPNQTITPDDIIEGMHFRNTASNERLKKVEKSSVIARARISDKVSLVKCLKQKGRVAVIGGFSGDEKVFKEADMSFFPGIQESQFMMEKSDIVIKDGSFTTIASAMRRVRGMHNTIQIFAQFQFIVAITSLVTDSVTTIFGGEPPTINTVAAISSGKIPFTALQILWVKLIVGTLVVLALSIDDPAESLVQLMPVDQTGPFVTNTMWRDIIGQSLCQIVILLTIQFEGVSTFKLNSGEKDTLIFNTLVLCQIFNIFNGVNGKNLYEILTKKRLFWMVIGIIILIQVVIVELLGRFAGTKRLNWKQWRDCIGISIISWLIGWILRMIPVPEKPFFSRLYDHKAD